MTMLNLGMAAVIPVGDDAPVMIRRWMLVCMIPVLMTLGGYDYAYRSKTDERIKKLEAAPAPSDTQLRLIDQRVAAIEKLIAYYEGLRMERERQISELQTDRKNMQQQLDRMDGKLDRLLQERKR